MLVGIAVIEAGHQAKANADKPFNEKLASVHQAMAYLRSRLAGKKYEFGCTIN